MDDIGIGLITLVTREQEISILYKFKKHKISKSKLLDWIGNISVQTQTKPTKKQWAAS